MELSKYKVCPECGKHNPPSLLECRYCEADLTGIKVVDDTTEQPASAPEPSKKSSREKVLVRICSECGAENAPQSRKCRACGEDISDAIPSYVAKKVKKIFSYELTAYDGTFSITIDKPLVVVGREAVMKDYLLPKVYVSRQHARLTVVANKVFIENLSHTNKTFINNKEIPDGIPTALKNGDEIGLGGKEIDGRRQNKAAYFIIQVLV